jgi:hypothetical protein
MREKDRRNTVGYNERESERGEGRKKQGMKKGEES